MARAPRDQVGPEPRAAGTGGMPRSYWLLVALLAVLVVGAYILLQEGAGRSRGYAAEIEYAGGQLAVTREIGWLVEHLVTAGDPRTRQRLGQELTAAARQMLDRHERLRREGGRPGPANTEGGIRVVPYPDGALDRQVRAFAARARDLALAPPGAQTPAHPAYRYLSGDAQQRLARTLQASIRGVQRAQREGLARLQLMQGAGVLLGALLVLLLVAGAVASRLHVGRGRRAAERWSDLLLQTVAEGILAVDREGRITQVNPAAARMLGYRPEELLGHSLHDTLHHSHADGSEHRWEDCPMSRSLVAGEVVQSDEEFLWREDGQALPVEFVSAPIRRDGAGVGAVMAFKDIRDRKETEAERDRLVAIIEATPDFVGFAEPDGRVLYRNPGALRLLTGAPDAADPQHYLWERRPEWAARKVRDEALPAVLRDGIWEGETAILGPDDVEIPLSQLLVAHRNAQNEVTHISTVAHDIRERKRLEATLRTAAAREETLANAVINALPGLYFLVDEDGHFHRWNTEVERVTGYGPERIGAMRPTDFIAEADHARALAAMEQGFCEGQASLEAQLRTASGRAIPYLFSASRIELEGRAYLNGVAVDISRRKDAEERLHFALRCAHAGTWDWDVESGTLQWSEETDHLFGRDPDAAGPPGYAGWLQRVHPDDRAAVEADIRRAMDGGRDDFYVEYRIHHPQNGERWLAQWGRISYGPEGTARRVTGLGLDITERKETEQELERLATLDDLTGAYNRRSADSFLKNAISQVQRYGQPLSVVLFDIDHFKMVNDTYGHEEGDTVLKAVVAAAGRALRDADILSRWGGEEFLVLAPKTDLEGTLRLAERMRGSVDEATAEAIHVTASFGVAQYRPGEAASRLLKRVDDALYRAKENGRNRVERAPDLP